MRSYTQKLKHMSDAALLSRLASLHARGCGITAELLETIAEVDERRLYVPAGYDSMYAYCVGELHLSEDAAYKRIQAARIARQFPVLFETVADGRLHLTAVGMLAPHLTVENVDELIAAATHQSKAVIQRLLAQCVAPGNAAPPLLALAAAQLAPAQVESDARSSPASVAVELAPASRALFDLHFRVGQGAHDKWRYAQALLSHSIPGGDAEAVFERAVDALIAECEKTKFAATSRPRSRPRPTSAPRHVPAHVKRAVWERDQGRCTFVGNTGHRCGSRNLLEFDHADPVARGGEATVDRMRLRCRAHNQYEAERLFGAEFMDAKRGEARHAAAEARARAAAATAATAEQTRLVISGLRQLGCRADEARRAAEHAAAASDGGTLEEHLRAALKLLRPPRSPVAPKVNAASFARPDPATVGS